MILLVINTKNYGMNKEKGSTLIGTIALIAVAVLVGILIGAKKDEITTEIDSMRFDTPIIKIHKEKPAIMQEEKTPDTQTTEKKA